MNLVAQAHYDAAMNANSSLDKSRPHPLHIALGACFALLWLGCIPEDGGGDFASSDIEGTVGGEAFTLSSGSADLTVDGTYVVTLADTPEFTCTASSGLPSDYLQIVISDVDQPTTFDASGHVFFNVFEGGVSVGEAAQSGTVTIDEVDTFGGVVSGYLEAESETSSVSGSFSVDICQ